MINIKNILIGFIVVSMVIPQIARAETFSDRAAISDSVIGETNEPSFKVVKKVKMVITAYSSTPEQTDNTPFVTASGKSVIDGVVANNMLPFGAKIRMPELYGDKIFVVEDRMNQRKGKYHIDVWLPEYSEAKSFGARITYVEVLES